MVFLFFGLHWVLCVLMQSLFQHRYAAHRMFTMSPFAERAMHLSTAIIQGTSYINPRGYALLHREHHAFADTDRDPHSPVTHKNPVRMMLATVERYNGLVSGRIVPEQRFLGGAPEWPAVDRFFDSWVTRLAFGGLYAAFYLVFATQPWQWLLLPVQLVMGPLHGSIVNWCGHRYGRRNFATRDESRNTLPVDFLCMGELFQNNHHARPASPNFAARRFELDPTWHVMRLLAWLKVIELPAHATRTQSAKPETHPAGSPQLSFTKGSP